MLHVSHCPPSPSPMKWKSFVFVPFWEADRQLLSALSLLRSWAPRRALYPSAKILFRFCMSISISFFFFISAARKRPYEGYTSSDSEEEILRRLRMQQSDSMHSGHLSKYGAGTLNENLSGLQHISIASHREKFHDPLGVAERGKVGVPPSSSECSSNSSADASVESNMGILNGERKGKTLPIARRVAYIWFAYFFRSQIVV